MEGPGSGPGAARAAKETRSHGPCCVSFFLFHLVSELEVAVARSETRSDRCTRDCSDKNYETAASHGRLTSLHLPADVFVMRHSYATLRFPLLPMIVTLRSVIPNHVLASVCVSRMCKLVGALSVN